MDIFESFNFFKKAHEGQRYREGLPYWYHLYSVGLMLKSIIEEHGEMDNATKESLIIAAYGHDSLEDTDLTSKAILDNFGHVVLEFIEGMTNKKGDHDTKEYEEQILLAREEVRILKMVDSIDNYTRIAYRMPGNDPAWLEKNVIPIMEDLSNKIVNTSFVKYPKTGEDLKRRLRTAHKVALEAIKIAKSD